MKTLVSITAAGLASVLLAFSPIFEQETLTIKPEASNIEWFAEKVTGKHNGTVSLGEGVIEIANGKLAGGKFNVDMTSITVTDLEGVYQQKLEGHLKSPDFFSVKEFPTSTFVIKEARPVSEGEFNARIKGALTIKGITNPIEFPAKVEIKDGKFAAYGEMVIDRSKYNVRYGSNSFFDDLGDKAIYDDFKMKVSIGAKR